MRRVVGFVTVALLVVAGFVAYSNRQFFNDVIAANTFDPPPEIASLTASLDLTDRGHRVFFASKPSLDDAQQFNEHCSAVEHDEQGHILGCFSNDRIFLFNVQDERLAGIVEVTAAHELLHAVFQRIQGAERTELVDRLWAYYDEIKSAHPELEERMSVYSHLSRVQFANELHSVFGTEDWPLSVWLQQHYARWFADQPMIASLHQKFSETFNALHTRADEISAELDSIRADVEQRRAAYREAVEVYNAEIAEFKRRNEAFEFSNNVGEFERLRADFAARAAALDAEREAINAEITRYEQLRAELNELSALNTELQAQLSSEAPATEPPAV